MNWLANTVQVGESQTAAHWFSTPLEIILLLALLLTLSLGFRYLKKAVEKRFTSLEDAITDSSAKIAELHDSITDSSSVRPRTVRREEIIKEVSQVGRKVDTVGDEVTSRCGTLNCPVVPVVTRELTDIRKELSHFCEEGRRTREETKQLIDSIFSRISNFVDSVGERMMELLEKMTDRK